MKILIFTNILMLIVLIKYYFNNKNNIKKLKIERDKYRQQVWDQKVYVNPLENSFNQLNDIIIQISKNKQVLINDIKNTDFSNNIEEIKESLIDAIDNIEVYGE